MRRSAFATSSRFWANAVLPSADSPGTGEVSFAKLDAGETRVHYQLEYEPAAWGVDEAGLRRCLQARVRDDLRAFKSLAEALAAP